MVGSGLPFLFIGTAVAYSIPTGSLQVTIGVVLLGIMFAQFASEGSSHEPPTFDFGGAGGNVNVAHVTAVGVAAACSGYLMGLCGIPGPPLMILLAFFISVELTAWRATAAVVQWVLGSIQVVILAYLGAVKVRGPEWAGGMGFRDDGVSRRRCPSASQEARLVF
jgi:hypothetical protein